MALKLPMLKVRVLRYLRKREKVNKVKAGSLLLLGFMVVYIPSVFHWIYGNNTTTDILRMSTIEESYNVQGTSSQR